MLGLATNSSLHPLLSIHHFRQTEMIPFEEIMTEIIPLLW